MNAIELDGAYNVRDLGGLRVIGGGFTRYGIVYRGDSLDLISNRDEEVLFGQLNIRAVIDLRTNPEVRQPDRIYSLASYYRFPLIDENRLGKEPFPSDDPHELAKVYLNNVIDGREAVGKVLATLDEYLSVGMPCIYNCAAGRDRTGVITALLLSVSNVFDSDISADYALSNRHAHHVTRRLAENPLYSNNTAKRTDIILLKRETILLFLSLVRETYGSVEQFLLSCGLSSQTLASLRLSLVGKSD